MRAPIDGVVSMESACDPMLDLGARLTITMGVVDAGV